MTKKELLDLIRKEVSEGKLIDELIDILLEGFFFPKSIKSDVSYDRRHDDCDGENKGIISVMVYPMISDVIVNIFPRDCSGLRFRTWEGGGMSLRVRNALLILAAAIKKDNEERPQY